MSADEDIYTAGQLSNFLTSSTSATTANQDASLASLFASGSQWKEAETATKTSVTSSSNKKDKLLKRKKPDLKTTDQQDEDDPQPLDRSAMKARAKLAKERELARATDPRNPRTVFVGNVSARAKKRDLLLLFRQHGPIESVRFRSAAPVDAGVVKRLAVIHKKLSRQSLNAYIVYKEVDSVTKAIEACNGHCLDGLHLRVDCLSSGGSSGAVDKKDDKKCVFLGNLHFKCDEESVRAAFSPCGRVTNVRLVRDSRSGIGRGFGFVQFADASSVELALKLAGTEVAGRAVRVSRCSGDNATASAKSLKVKENKKMRPQKSTKIVKDDSKMRKQSRQDSKDQSKRFARKAASSAPPTNRTFAQAFQQRLEKRKARALATAGGAKKKPKLAG